MAAADKMDDVELHEEHVDATYALRGDATELQHLLSRVSSTEQAALVGPIVSEARDRVRAIMAGDASADAAEGDWQPPKRSRISLPPPVNDT